MISERVIEHLGCRKGKSCIIILGWICSFILQVPKKVLMNIIGNRRRCWKGLRKWIQLQNEGTCPVPPKWVETVCSVWVGWYVKSCSCSMCCFEAWKSTKTTLMEKYVFDNMTHCLHHLQRGSFCWWSECFNLAYLLQEERDNIKKGEKFAIQVSNIMNMVIFTAKVYACVRSGSLAIIASTLDSLLDLLSGFILWFTSISMRKENPYLYPIGKRRMQPLVNFYFDS